jgi:hypothetical protein
MGKGRRPLPARRNTDDSEHLGAACGTELNEEPAGKGMGDDRGSDDTDAG